MAWVIEALNPFEPTKIEKHFVEHPITISEWVSLRYPETKEFPGPVICLFNGVPLLRKEWSKTRIDNNNVVSFVSALGWEFVIALVISVVISLAVTLLMPVPDIPGTDAASDPVFSIKGQQNSIRLGEPIESSYGRNRIYPSYAARPYYQYEDNDQYQHSLFCLGQGEYEVHEVLIGDSPISSFEEAYYEIVPPGEKVTLFPTNVFTSAEAGGQSLWAPNQPDYVGEGWVGPFVSNPSGTTATVLQLDIIYPKGLYIMNQKGWPAPMSVTIEAQKRLIDDSGAPLGDWEFFDLSEQYKTVQGQTTTPQRRTFGVEVPPGRYEVRVRRTSDFLDLSRAGNDVVWEGMRSWLDIEHDYGNVTLLAVQIRASSNLNDRTAQKFNVIATRKLPIRDATGVWSAPTPTRSIVWAFVDVFRSAYGGRIVNDSFFDWDTLLALDALYTERNEHFDWIFRDPITCWDAAKTIALAGRAVPLIAGSLITLKRDGPLSVPVAMFNQENIEGNFEWQIKLWDLDEHDSLRVEYTDPTTGYRQETVMCILPGGTSDHPQDIRLMGVQDRTHAYREGLYRLAVSRYLRENVSFNTGLEGYIPTYGDLIAVCHDVPNWGQGGYVVDAKRGADDMYHVWLSEPLIWNSGENYQILLRSRTGAIIGPFDALQTEDDKQVAFRSAQEIDFLLTGTTEPMLFLFGPVGNVTKQMKVIRVEPQGQETVKITAVNENPIVHSFDGLSPLPLRQDDYAPVVPDLPEITNLYLTPLDGTSISFLLISWTAAYGALSYLVQTSTDGENYEDRARISQTSLQLQVTPGDLWVRVAAIGNGQGPWIYGQIGIGPIVGIDLLEPWIGLNASVGWIESLNAAGYRLEIYDVSGVSPVLKITEDLPANERTYTIDGAYLLGEGFVGRNLLIKVDVLYQGSSGVEPSDFPAELQISNALPTISGPFGYTVESVTLVEVEYRVSWFMHEYDDDVSQLRIWLSPTDGFDPDVTVPVIDLPIGVLEGEATEIVSVPLDSNGEHPTYYWRVGLRDSWSNDWVISPQQTILAYS